MKLLKRKVQWKVRLLSPDNKNINVGRLLDDLKSGILPRQIDACKSLGRGRCQQAIPQLLSLYSIAPAPLKQSIVTSLGFIGSDTVVEQLAGFYSGSFEHKIEVITALRRIGGKASIFLQRLFNEETLPELKRQIVSASGALGKPEVLPWLESIIQKADPELIMTCLKAAISVDSAWVMDRMRSFLVSGDHYIKIQILQVLPEIPDFPSQGLIGEILQLFHSGNDDLKTESASCLALIGDAEAIRQLRPALKSEDTLLVRKLLSGIRRVNDIDAAEELIPLLMVSDRQLRQDASDTIFLLANVSIFDKIFKLLDSEFIEARTLAIKLFGRLEILDEEKRNAVEERLKFERNETLIAQIFTSLSIVSDSEKLNDLVAKAQECEISQRFKIVGEIQMEGNRKSVRFLSGLLSAENNEKVRAMIVATMGMIGSADDVSQISSALNDEDPRVRANAIEALDQVSQDESVIELIVPFLQDFNNRVKANAAMSLWNRGGLRMLALLERMLHENPDRWHRASAAYALGEIGNLQAQKILLDCIEDSESVVRANIIKALGKIGDRSCIPIIMGRFTVELPMVREQILIALSDLGGIEAQQLFMNTLASGDSALRSTAMNALKKTADSSIIPDLITMMNSSTDPELISSIIEILGSCGDERALSQLRNYFEHDDFEVQTKACNSYVEIEKRLDFQASRRDGSN